MTATANVEQGTINAVVDIAARPEAVFRALTDPKELEAWWGSEDTYRTSDWKIDLRVGGQWSCAAKDPSGGTQTVKGEYLAVDPPRLLEYTWLPSWEDFAPTTVRCELEATSTGTRPAVAAAVGVPGIAVDVGSALAGPGVLADPTTGLLNRSASAMARIAAASTM